MEIAIYGKTADESHTSYLQGLFNKLRDMDAGVFIYEPFHDFLKQKITLPTSVQTFKKHEDLKQKVNYLMSIGGDGTFLETISLVKDSGIPIIGINMGRLGFLASVSKEEIDTALDALAERKYSLDKRTILRLETKSNLFGDLNYALNEVTVQKRDSSSMITIHAYINGVFLNSYWADGLIIATPTGSTAYSLSCGGPIVLPDSENFVITPIAPHNLNVRPLIISDNDTITLKVEGRSDQYLLSLDSHTEIINSTEELKINKASFKINLIQFDNHNFLNTLRNKLMWGIDRRN